MAVKKGLGKGLDGLIQKSPVVQPKREVKNKETVTVKTGEVKLKITEIEPNREQPRKNFDEDALLELADSIRQVGILSPILVQKREDYYEIIAGERRWRAAKLAGLKEVPVIIKEFTEQEILEVSLIENIQRERLNPIEEALAYQKLIQQFHLKQDEVAERVGKSRTVITNSMRMLKLDERVQQMVVDEMISTGHARALLAIEDKEQQFLIATRVFDEKLSVRDIEKIVRDMNKPERQRRIIVPISKDLSIIYQDAENKMASVMGSKVHINSKTEGKGKIEIDFYSTDELDRIMQMIMSMK